MKTYEFEELFKEDPNDPDNLLMIIPDEMVDELGLAEGDELTVEVTERGIEISIKG